MKVEKFIEGLREDLRRKKELIPNLTFSLACSNALTLEKYSKKKLNTGSNRPMRNTNMRNMVTHAHTANQTITQEKTSSLTITPNKDINTRDLKGVVCFKSHGHGHIKSECPNVRAFTLQEWKEIREEGRPKAMLVSKNGREEVAWPRDDPDGSYFVNDEGVLETFEGTEESEEEEDREVVYPEQDLQSLLIRRNFHATLKIKPNDQRENIFKPNARLRTKFVI